MLGALVEMDIGIGAIIIALLISFGVSGGIGFAIGELGGKRNGAIGGLMGLGNPSTFNLMIDRSVTHDWTNEKTLEENDRS